MLKTMTIAASILALAGQAMAPAVTGAPVPTGEKLVVDGAQFDILDIGGEKYVDTAIFGSSGPFLLCPEDPGLPTLQDPERGVTYVSPSAERVEPAKDVNVPVLMYHAVSDDCWGLTGLFVKPAEMEKQLKYLVDNGYDPIWFSDLDRAGDFDRPVILTFDDGYDNNYTQLFPLLVKYNVKATFFIATDLIGRDRYMTPEQVREVSDSGLVSVQSHTRTHGDMSAMDETQLTRELAGSRLAVARMTGRIPTVICYPSGKNSALARKVAARYYQFGVRMSGGMFNTSDDPFKINRYTVLRDTDMASFAKKVSGAGS